MSEEDDRKLIEASLRFYGESLDWLEQHHSHYAENSPHDLAAKDRVNAIWKLAGQSLSLSRSYLGLLDDGYTTQTWPISRAIHEADRLLGAVADVDEKAIVDRWLDDKKVEQKKARAAEQRQLDRINQQMKDAGFTPIDTDVAGLSKTIYGLMSKAAHHQRSVVDEAIDHEKRTMVYGPDPRIRHRVEYVVYAGLVFQEVLLKVGDALSVLYGPGFYEEHLKPMLNRFQEMLDALELIQAAQRFGLAG